MRSRETSLDVIADELPVWARGDAFPEKPQDASPYGIVLDGVVKKASKRVATIECTSLEELVQELQSGEHEVGFVWVPESEHLLVPEELAELRSYYAERRMAHAQRQCADGKLRTIIISVVMMGSFLGSLSSSDGDWMSALRNTSLGIMAIMLLIFGLAPMYEGWKEKRRIKGSRSEEEWASFVGEMRFETWLERQKTLLTTVLLGMLVLTGLAQLYMNRGFGWAAYGLTESALVKDQGEILAGQWWRYFTAPMLHGNILHWFMNAAALGYLARRMECLTGWPHVLIVYLGSALLGGWMSVKFLPTMSVGASGGIMGVLGFLLVFETLHAKLVPLSARRRLLVGVVMTALMGVLGVQFIDNAAHAGGFIFGAAYAWWVFPKSKSARRPRVLKQDYAVGALALSVLVASALYTMHRLLN